MTLCRTFTNSTLLALSLVVCAGVSLPGCGDKGGYRGGKKTKARQWLDNPSSGEKSGSFIKFPQVGFAHTHAARLALSGAVAAMVRELIPHNVTINTVCPGLFDTDALHTNLHAHAARGNTTYEEIVQDRLKGCPAGRFADPAECGDLIAYICSAQAGFMSGQNIVNDGGVYQGLF